jgi:hypothetical protein
MIYVGALKLMCAKAKILTIKYYNNYYCKLD